MGLVRDQVTVTSNRRVTRFGYVEFITFSTEWLLSGIRITMVYKLQKVEVTITRPVTRHRREEESRSVRS